MAPRATVVDVTEPLHPVRRDLHPIAAWLSLQGQTADECRDVAHRAEALGYGAIWIPETPTSREVFTQASLLLSATESLTVGTGIANIWARDATSTAAARVTLDDAYPGRFVLGLGTSHKSRVADRGHDYAKPLAAMREYLVSFRAAGPFAPLAAIPGPVVLAALGPRMQELARDAADGVHSFFVTPAHTTAVRKRIGEGRLLIPQQAFVVEGPDNDAMATARTFVASRLALPNYVNHLLALGFDANDLRDGGTPDLVKSLVAVGSVDEVATRLRAHLDAGASQVAAHPLVDDDGGAAQLAALAPALAGLLTP
jgi:probable F420-dependent oxidoreductase